MLKSVLKTWLPIYFCKVYISKRLKIFLMAVVGGMMMIYNGKAAAAAATSAYCR